MGAYLDLHCHWVAEIDDGASSVAESADLLKALRDIGFAKVIGTPHMRAGLFENSREDIEQAYAATVRALEAHSDLPELDLAAEHHLDDVAYRRLINGRGLLYPPSGRCALIEFPYDHFPLRCAERFFELRCKKIRPVLAHPERYRPVWKDIEVLDPLLDGGALLLLDLAALDGKYGRGSKKTAIELLEAGYYYAACSDAHSAKDVKAVGAGLKKLVKLMGEEEADFMLRQGPQNIVAGQVVDG